MRSYRLLATLGMILISTPSYAKWLAVGGEEVVVADRLRVEGNPAALSLSHPGTLAPSDLVTSDLVTSDLVTSEMIDSALRHRREWNALVPPETREALGIKETTVTANSQVSFEDSLQKLHDASPLDTMRKHMEMVLIADRKIIKRVVADWDATLAFYGVSPDPKQPATAVAQNDYSNLVTTQAHPQQIVGQETALPLVTTQPTQAAPANSNDQGPVGPQPATEMASNDPLDAQPTEKAEVFYEYSEAFQPALEVFGVRSKMISHETQVEGQELGWAESFTQDAHDWPTLTWTDSSLKETVPMISRNTALQLSTLAGAQLRGDHGIVFGKVAAGWDVELSGDTTPPVLLTMDRQLVPNTQEAPGQEPSLDTQNAKHLNATQDRYFAFVNVQPGYHLVYFKYRATGLQGAVAAPVEPGKATYLQLMDIRKESVSGRVVVARKNQGGSAAGTTVRVLGQDAAAGLTAEDGSFEFSPVMTVANYPIYLESDRGIQDFTHRYRYFPGRLHNLTLKRMTTQKIQAMLGQLPGGALDGSGMVLANASHLVDRYPEGFLLPEVTALDPKARMHPQTFVPAPGGELLGGTDARLSNHKEWFVGLQVPEGGTLASVKDDAGKVLGSQLIPASPATVYLFEF